MTITVRPSNSRPLANADNYTTEEDSLLIVSNPGVLANDTDPDGDALTALLVGQPSHGSISFNVNGGFSYRPATNYFGSDSFTYRAIDLKTNSLLATVTIVVTPRNDPPIAANDAYATDKDVSLTISAHGVLGNDVDPDSDPLSAILITPTSQGVIQLRSNGSLTYVPTNNYSGPDSFTYQASDGVANSAIATVALTVRPLNDPPIARDDAYATDKNVPLNVLAPGGALE